MAAAPPTLDVAAPPLSVEEVFPGGDAERLGPGVADVEVPGVEALAGKAVVIEFWATWCGPCVVALGHWNELVDELAGEPIVFLSVTTEEAETVRSFLARTRVAGLVGIDADGSMFRDYGVSGIPHTVLIDPDGVLRAETYPSSLTVESLRDLVGGRELDLPRARSFDDRMALAVGVTGSPEALFAAEIRPSTDPELRGMKVTATEYLGFGWLPEEAISAVYEWPPTRLDVRAELPEQRFDLLLRAPPGNGERLELLQVMVAQSFGVDVSRELRSRQVLLLGRTDGAPPALRRASGTTATFGWRPGVVRGRGLDLSSLSSALESLLEEPVVDVTGLEGRYDVELEWDPRLVGDLERALGELGLELVGGRREIEILVVRPRNGAAGP